MGVKRVQSPPAKPLMIFDGDCHFCAFWIRRWQHSTCDRVEYVPFQNREAVAHFPELSREEFENSVQFIQPDGSVYSGAEAVFRSLAVNPRQQLPLQIYQKVPGFAAFSEWGYRFVAHHRTAFSKLTRLFYRHA